MSTQFPMMISTILLITTTTLIPHSVNAQNYPHDYVSVHNTARAEVGIGPMRWNTTLAHYAESYAKKRTDCEMIHSEGPYGENIYAGWGDEEYTSGYAAVKDWYSEKPYYDYQKNECLSGEDCLHYTQMVWKESTSIGCARSQCRDGGFFVICSYHPPGNAWGERPF